ncbi:hypothetical protein OUZ56_016492 [Daphnia magna]|uniref:Uncharacterized protein n=1 Tax=Daphnia magna TaxID=35525 RepID=A0ABR0AQS7_9CRUS|nr:hypothetical protein OUZ56_016492 [Daphnia magna]
MEQHAGVGGGAKITEKRARFFRTPKDEVLLKLWAKKIPTKPHALSRSARQPILPAETIAVGARRPNRWPCPFKPSQSQPIKSLPVSARLIPHSLCPSAQSLSTKTPAVVDRLPCPCPCPPSPSQFLLVNPLAAHKKPAVVAPQLPNSLWPSSSSLPVNQQWIRKNAQYISARRLLLPVDLLAAFARHITHSLCPSTPSLPIDPIVALPVHPLIVCARQPNLFTCPSTHSQSLPVDSLTVFARRLTHSLCPSTQSLPAKISAVFARRIIHSLCPSSHSLPTKMPNEVARQLIYCLWLSNP